MNRIKLFAIGGAAIVACLAAGIGIGILLTRDFEQITEASLLRYLVDREIREINGFTEAKNVVYSSRPVNGTSRSVNSIAFTTNNVSVSHADAIRYFISLGYKKDSFYELSRDGEEVSIEDIGSNRIVITKYSWE